jgi:GalNAc-alpha-(1->4)-GalNAc-alpha-(1->3)-diNAcBac-PP-undecaprenol alpha-1,4-N-acetyl-D-galactosaminyltransferase
LKILLVAQTLRKGGAERVVSLLSQEFEKQGHKVKIILFDKKIEYEYGGEIINLNTPASPNYIIKLIRLFQRIIKLKGIFKKEKPDLILSFMESCNFASILTGYEIVVSIRNNPEKKLNWYQKKLIKILYNFHNVKKVITVSRGIEKILNEKYHINNTLTIYNPVTIDKNYSIKEDLSKYQPYILGVGRLHKQKNFPLLIEAFSKTKAKDFLNLIIVGEGKERQNLEKLIEKLNLNDKVFLVDKKDNIKDYYLQAEIFVLSSKFEGFPNVLVEALSNGCACISTDCPTGPNEIIKDGENGILVKNENIVELAKAIDEVYFDKNLSKKLKNNAANSIKNLYLENVAKKWLEI